MSEAGMTTIPLEDEFGDVIGKARRGLGLEPAEVAQRADLDEGRRAKHGGLRAPADARRKRPPGGGVGSLHAPSLWDVATEAWRPQAQAPTLAGGLQVRMIPYPPMRVTMYIVGDPATGDALVGGPGGVAGNRAGNGVRASGWRVTGYLITHGDADHIDALAAVYAQAPAPLWVHEGARSLVHGVDEANLNILTADGPFTVGPFALEALETPGHAPGHTAYALRDGVLVGDTVFAGSIGGTRTGNLEYAEQLAAIRAKLLTRDDATSSFPDTDRPRPWARRSSTTRSWPKRRACRPIWADARQ